jgi:hypothetical protein
MSIRYGRSLPKSPRPKPPQPKLGDIGIARVVARVQPKRKKTKRAKASQATSNKGSQPTNTSYQPQTEQKRKKKKAKLERSRQNTPVRVEIVNPAQPSFANTRLKSSRVVVEWKRAGRRYLAWGKEGVKAVDGWQECSAETRYQQLVQKLHPIGIHLNVTNSQIPVVEILDLIIASGKVLSPRLPLASLAPAADQPRQSRRPQRRARSGARRDQSTRQSRSAAAETARNDVLVIRPNDGKPSAAARRRRSSSQAANDAQKRRQMLARQRRELRRLNWLRRHGYEERHSPNDMMHIALQGGSPGLKR